MQTIFNARKGIQSHYLKSSNVKNLADCFSHMMVRNVAGHQARHMTIINISSKHLRFRIDPKCQNNLATNQKLRIQGANVKLIHKVRQIFGSYLTRSVTMIKCQIDIVLAGNLNLCVSYLLWLCQEVRSSKQARRKYYSYSLSPLSTQASIDGYVCTQ